MIREVKRCECGAPIVGAKRMCAACTWRRTMTPGVPLVRHTDPQRELDTQVRDARAERHQHDLEVTASRPKCDDCPHYTSLHIHTGCAVRDCLCMVVGNGGRKSAVMEEKVA